MDLSPRSSKLNTSRWWLLQWCCSAAEHDDLLSVSPSSSSSPDQCQQSARTPAHSMARLEKLQEHGSEEKYFCANKIFVTSTQQCSRYNKKWALLELDSSVRHHPVLLPLSLRVVLSVSHHYATEPSRVVAVGHWDTNYKLLQSEVTTNHPRPTAPSPPSR